MGIQKSPVKIIPISVSIDASAFYIGFVVRGRQIYLQQKI